MFNAVLRADRKVGLTSDAGARNEVGFSLIQVIFIRRITANFKGRPGNRTGRKIKEFTGSLRHAKDNQCLTGDIIWINTGHIGIFFEDFIQLLASNAFNCSP